MSDLRQQRIRIVSTHDGSREPWAAFCPCCMTAYCFRDWATALGWTLRHLQHDHCRFCIDRQMPAGREDVLGELFEICPVCTPACLTCDGIAVFPANYNTPTELVQDLAILRLTVVFCDGCYGVVAVLPLDPEVYV